MKHTTVQLPHSVPLYRQYRDDNTCGPVCIRMVLDYFLKPLGKRVSKEDLRKILYITMKGDKYRGRGTFREELIAALNQFGISTEELSGDKSARLRQLTRSLEHGTPAILTCLADLGRDGRMGHFIVVTGIDDQYLYINDPYPGRPSRVKIDSFLKRGQPINWDKKMWGVALEAVPLNPQRNLYDFLRGKEELGLRKFSIISIDQKQYPTQHIRNMIFDSTNAIVYLCAVMPTVLYLSDLLRVRSEWLMLRDQWTGPVPPDFHRIIYRKKLLIAATGTTRAFKRVISGYGASMPTKIIELEMSHIKTPH